MTANISIPNTDLKIYPMGLGTVGAGLKWDGAEADNLFDCFLDMGGNLIDTAHMYSDWIKPERARSERVIGDWLFRSGKRDKIILMTKGGHPDIACKNPDIHNNRMTKADMISDLDGSLTKLRTDYVDVYFYHRDDTAILTAELIDTMEDFRKQGKIRYYGCSNWSAKRIKEADIYCKNLGYRGFCANQALLNLGSRYMNPLEDDTMKIVDEEMQKYHEENLCNLAVPYMGIASGFFHNYIVKGQDAVKESPYYTKGNRKIAEKIPRLMEKYNCSITQVVLGFFTKQDFPCVPLFGPNDIASLKDSMKTFYIAFEKEDYISE